MAQANNPADARQLVAEACHVLADNGQTDMVWGHVSSRDEAGRGIWMKSHTFGFDEIEPDNVLLVSLDGEVLEGSGRRHSEYPIHTEIMRARHDVNCVVHTHSMNVTAFAATAAPLRPINHDACLFVPPDIARFTKTGDLIRSADMGRELAAALGERNALIIPNHGMVATGSSVAQAIMAAVLLDRACRAQLMAGEVRNWSPDEEATTKRDKVWSPENLELGWAYLRRQAERHRSGSIW